MPSSGPHRIAPNAVMYPQVGVGGERVADSIEAPDERTAVGRQPPRSTNQISDVDVENLSQVDQH